VAAAPCPTPGLRVCVRRLTCATQCSGGWQACCNQTCQDFVKYDGLASAGYAAFLPALNVSSCVQQPGRTRQLGCFVSVERIIGASWVHYQGLAGNQYSQCCNWWSKTCSTRTNLLADSASLFGAPLLKPQYIQPHKMLLASAQAFMLVALMCRRDGRRRLMVPNTAFVSREFMVYDEGPEALRPHGMGSSSNWWWHQKSSSSAQDHQASSAAAAGGVGGVGAAGQSSSTDRSSRGQQQAAERQRSSSPEPSIVEGHMTTQLPPLAQPVYPGMHFVAPHHPAYPPFPAMHYQQPPLHPYHYQDPYYLQQQQQQEAGAANVDSWHQHQQDQQQQQGSDQQQQQEGQQEPSSQPQSRPVAKGPPGYLPQGFAAGPPYLGIPVGTLYYGVPGVVPWGTGGTAGVTAQPPQHTAPAAGPSANAGSGLADGRQQQQQPGQPWQQQQQPAQPWQQHGKASAQGASSAPSTDDDSGSSRCGGPGGSGGNAGGSSSSSIKGSQEATGQRRAGVPAPPAKQQSTGGGSSSTAGSAGSAAAASQQQQQQSAPLPVSPSGPGVQVPSHSMHVAAGLGFGMWGLAPGTPLQSPGSPHYLADLGMQGVSMGASPVGVWQPVSSGYSSLHHPAEPQLSQQEQQQQQQLPPHEAASAAAGAGVQGDAGVAAAAAAAAPADTEASQSTNLVFAVLQEITRQQL